MLWSLVLNIYLRIFNQQSMEFKFDIFSLFSGKSDATTIITFFYSLRLYDTIRQVKFIKKKNVVLVTLDAPKWQLSLSKDVTTQYLL